MVALLGVVAFRVLMPAKCFVPLRKRRDNCRASRPGVVEDAPDLD
jgi:hypothetical protein